ncbi:MAG: hypothetical protein KGJ13_07545 [Patescibacteria group bacterium]|nr:hypothetical protein [Patescibacteria group bacterium]
MNSWQRCKAAQAHHLWRRWKTKHEKLVMAAWRDSFDRAKKKYDRMELRRQRTKVAQVKIDAKRKAARAASKKAKKAVEVVESKIAPPSPIQGFFPPPVYPRDSWSNQTLRSNAKQAMANQDRGLLRETKSSGVKRGSAEDLLK